jgi:hypothetical protein
LSPSGGNLLGSVTSHREALKKAETLIREGQRNHGDNDGSKHATALHATQGVKPLTSYVSSERAKNSDIRKGDGHSSGVSETNIRSYVDNGQRQKISARTVPALSAGATAIDTSQFGSSYDRQYSRGDGRGDRGQRPNMKTYGTNDPRDREDADSSSSSLSDSGASSDDREYRPSMPSHGREAAGGGNDGTQGKGRDYSYPSGKGSPYPDLVHRAGGNARMISRSASLTASGAALKDPSKYTWWEGSVNPYSALGGTASASAGTASASAAALDPYPNLGEAADASAAAEGRRKQWVRRQSEGLHGDTEAHSDALHSTRPGDGDDAFFRLARKHDHEEGDYMSDHSREWESDGDFGENAYEEDGSVELELQKAARIEPGLHRSDRAAFAASLTTSEYTWWEGKFDNYRRHLDDSLQSLQSVDLHGDLRRGLRARKMKYLFALEKLHMETRSRAKFNREAKPTKRDEKVKYERHKERLP